MIFAELVYEADYSEVHSELVGFVNAHFSQVKSGIQGDSWIWISDGDENVAVDTFSSMKHQIKSKRPGAHVQRVIDALRLKYRLKVYEKPQLEGTEDD